MMVGLFRSGRQIRQFDMLMSLVAKSSRQSCLSLDSVFCSRIGGNWFSWEEGVRASLSNIADATQILLWFASLIQTRTTIWWNS